MKDYPAAVAYFTYHYGHPIGTGRNRTTFRDGDLVIKVPHTEVGEFANDYEASTWDSPAEPRAKTWVDGEFTALLGMIIIRAEFVTETGWSKEPDWTWAVDCGQVGLTKDGRLVAYDWDRY